MRKNGGPTTFPNNGDIMAEHEKTGLNAYRGELKKGTRKQKPSDLPAGKEGNIGG